MCAAPRSPPKVASPRRRSSPPPSPSEARSPAPPPGRSRLPQYPVRPVSARRGRVLSTAPATPGELLKPKRSAVATSRAAPTFTPSGANTELHDTANASARLPPHDSPLAFSSFTPSSVVKVAYGNMLLARATLASSAAVSVTILKVDPGGCRSSIPMPATARIAPLAGSNATTPPNCPPRASTAARCTPGEMVVRTAPPGFASTLASTLPPASSSPPGVPRRRSSRANSRPLVPTIASAGTPAASSWARSPAGIDPTSPTTLAPLVPNGELRDPASLALPSASTDPSRASSAARRGSAVRLVSNSPARSPGNRSARPHLTRGPLELSSTLIRKLSSSVPHKRVLTRMGTSIVPFSSRAFPVTSRLVCVAVLAASP